METSRELLAHFAAVLAVSYVGIRREEKRRTVRLYVPQYNEVQPRARLVSTTAELKKWTNKLLHGILLLVLYPLVGGHTCRSICGALDSERWIAVARYSENINAGASLAGRLATCRLSLSHLPHPLGDTLNPPCWLEGWQVVLFLSAPRLTDFVRYAENINFDECLAERLAACRLFHYSTGSTRRCSTSSAMDRFREIQSKHK